MKKVLSLLVLIPFVSACSADNYYYRESAPEIIVHNPSPFYNQPRVTRYHGHNESRHVEVVPSRRQHGHQQVVVPGRVYGHQGEETRTVRGHQSVETNRRGHP